MQVKTKNQIKREKANPEERTDRERVKDALKALRKKGYRTRTNFSCCGSCASYELGQKYGNDAKVVYYSRQGHHYSDKGRGERIMFGGLYFSWSGDGQEIADAFKAEGLVVDWDGTESNCVNVHSKDSKLATDVRPGDEIYLPSYGESMGTLVRVTKRRKVKDPSGTLVRLVGTQLRGWNADREWSRDVRATSRVLLVEND